MREASAPLLGSGTQLPASILAPECMLRAFPLDTQMATNFYLFLETYFGIIYFNWQKNYKDVTQTPTCRLYSDPTRFLPGVVVHAWSPSYSGG